MLHGTSRQIVSSPVVEVKDFSVNFTTADGTLNALDRVNLTIEKGEILGILGESGSGKSTLALSMMGMLPENAHVTGEVTLLNTTVSSPDISGAAFLKMKRKRSKILSEKLRNIRWKSVSMVFQGSMNAFNPVYTIYRQIAEVYRIHTDYDEETIRKKVTETVKKAGLNPVILDSYPHELSGGMKQRAVIAMALALNPTMVIADEPTTGLDVVTQARIIGELKTTVRNQVKSMVIISHDIGVVAQLATRVIVLYAGRIMEIGSIEDIYLNPVNPYTKASLESYPSLAAKKTFMRGIPGVPPDLMAMSAGCRFAPRCMYAKDICNIEDPPLVEVSNGHFSRCHFAPDIAAGKGELTSSRQTASDIMKHTQPEEEVMKVENLTKYFDLRTSLAGRIFSRPGSARLVRAVDHISFEVMRGEILGVVGESGSGKTTFGRTAISLIKPTSGKVILSVKNTNQPEVAPQPGVNVFQASSAGDHVLDVSAERKGRKETQLLREKTQMIFQDPYDSLDPKMTIFDIVREPIIAHRTTKDPNEELRMVKEALSVVRLNPPENFINRYPHELSGGERQRVAAARALVLKPDLLVADEPISMLDVSLRAGFMNLLLELRKNYGITIIYITHDLASARYVSDRIVVMYLGVAVELGGAEEVVSRPLHPYTKALIEAVPLPTPNWNPKGLKIIGEIGNAVNVPKGCRFYDRCVYRQEICRDNVPPRRSEKNHWYLCHFSQDELEGFESRGQP